MRSRLRSRLELPAVIFRSGRRISRTLHPKMRRHRRARELRDHAASGRILPQTQRPSAFVHVKVVRPYSHSLSDDEKLYRVPEELEADAATDPIKKFAELLMTDGIASSEDLAALRKEVDAEVNKASDIAVDTPQPAPETALRNVFSPDVSSDRSPHLRYGRRSGT